MEWQPIETAPKDGRWVWSIEPGDQLGYTIPIQRMVCFVLDHRMKGGGVWQKLERDIAPVCHPTHWMPLPEPPK